MKAFLSALVFCALLVTGTGLLFEYGITVSATDAYSLDSVRVGGDEPVSDRPGWSEDF